MRDRLKTLTIAAFVFGLAALSLSNLFPARAELLPIKTYTTANGLALNSINRIVFDTRGFIWFCTNEGLSRFDGYKFINYGIGQGLPNRAVNDLLETASGDYWLATNGGLVRFNPAGDATPQGAALPPSGPTTQKMFSLYLPTGRKQGSAFTSLIQDQAGEIWCGSETGLFHMVKKNGDYELTPTALVSYSNQKYHVFSLFADREGAIWAGSLSKIFRLLPNGKTEQYVTNSEAPGIQVLRLYEDGGGKIWAGTEKGLLELTPHPEADGTILKQVISIPEGLPGDCVRDIWQQPDGTYWAATDRGLCKFSISPDGQRSPITVYTKDNGLSDYYIKRVAGDQYGNLWIGTANAGVMRWFFGGFTTFGFQDGVASAFSVRENQTGELFLAGYVLENMRVGTGRHEKATKNLTDFQWRLGRFKDDKFTWVRPNVPRDVQFSVGWNQVSFQDSRGEWWIATKSGLFRFPKVNRFEDLAVVRPKAVYTARNGLSNDNVTRLFEDSKGDIWIATNSPELNGLDRWERATERIHQFSQAEGVSELKNRLVSALCEDRNGDIWLGLSSNVFPGGLARYRQGVFTAFDENSEAPKGNIYDLLIDSTGKLWIVSTTDGARRVDNPESQNPTFVPYTTLQGLSSNRLTSIAEDNYGRIYFGTGKGVDRLEPNSKEIRHFSNADGLPLGSVDDILRDHNGNLWFALTQGFSRFVPKPDSPSSPPPILIDRVRIKGQPHPISALGETSVNLQTLKTSDNQIEIEYVGLSFVPGDSLSYQCKLEGIDPDWREKTRQLSINFANLSPGTYRFLVRAVNANGLTSKAPASVVFTIATPLWRQGWFLAFSLIVIGGLTYAAYRYRVSHLLAIERMRTRIATDLHDEVGSSLSQIAILSEVARQQATSNGHPEPANSPVLEPMEKVASTSREALDAMSDIVWAINPQRDSLRDLSQRMRHFASDTLAARDIGLRFRAPEQDLSLDSDVRRQVFLIFKECVNNIARHADCTEVEVEFALTDHLLSLRVHDDGRGFAETTPQPGRNGGNGLLNMRRRAAELGGRLQVISSVGHGTTIKLKMPLGGRKIL